MSFLRNILTRTNPMENPGIPISNPSLISWLGGYPSATGRGVTIETAMRSSAVFRGVQIIAHAVGGMPLRVTRTKNLTEVKTSILTNDESMTQFERWTSVVAHLVLWGNAYIWKVRDPAGNITALIPVHPSRVQVKVENTDSVGLP